MALVSRIRKAFAAATTELLPSKQKPVGRPSRAEIAQTQFADMWGGWLQNPDEVLGEKSLGEGYDLYYKMLRKDAHLRSVVSKRVQGISSLPFEIVPADADNAASQQHAEVLALSIDRMSNWRRFVEGVASCAFYGFTVHEAMYDVMSDGWIYIAEMIHRHQNKFLFDNKRQLLLSPIVTGGVEGKRPLERKLVLAQGNTDGENPYGNGLAQNCYWLAWIKLESLKSGAIATERWGAPVVDAIIEGKLDDAEKENLESQLNSLTTCTYVQHSKAVALQLLESAKGKGEAPFTALVKLCDEGQSKVILGQTLTTDQGKVGSYSLGKVHADIEQDIVESDAENAMEVINNGPVKWLCDLNFGPDAMLAAGGYPKWVPQYEPPEDTKLLVEVIDTLHKSGLTIPVAWIREKTGIPEPQEGEEVLPEYAGRVLPADTETISTGDGSNDNQPDQPAKQSAPPAVGLLEVATALTDMFWEKKQANAPESPTVAVFEAPGVVAKKPAKGVKTIQIGAQLSAKPRFERRLRTLYANLRDELRHQGSTLDDFAGLTGFVDDIVRDQFQSQLARPLSLAVEDTIRSTARDLALQLDSVYNRQTFNSLVKDYLKVHAYDKGVVTEIAATVKTTLSENITRIIDSGDDLDGMVKALMQAVDDLGAYKAELIAQTECRQAANWATIQMAKNSKQPLEAWFMVDPASCDICQQWASRNPYSLKQAENLLLPHPGCNDHWALTNKESK